jgi:starch phosphorylase
MPAAVAYFCMEFGLHEDFPIYAGGLGVLAGDFVKSAHDLGLPVVAVGLRWMHGYARQRIGEDGQPANDFPAYDAGFLEDTGARVRVRIARRDVEARVWHTRRFANAPLYLLEPVAREDAWITSRLYEPTLDCRVAQEILLGIGGVRALRKLGLEVDTYHFNEGHAVFAGVEMIAERMAAGAEFREAWDAVRASIVFTTHTPIPAGNEVHALGDLRRLGATCELVDPEMRALGGDPFNMTVAGLRLARRANAVSELHGEVSRAMWKDVEGACPIVSITNGVHVPTWQDPRIREAATSPSALWTTHEALKGELVAAVQARTGTRLDPGVLTIGFARRAAAYKRSDLIFRDPARLEPLLTGRRLQLVFAGKAHPDDAEGRRIVANLVAMARRYPAHVVFVPDYDLALARTMTRGADVWLNNPIRPLEASGTSGMKGALNGVLNLSVLDGWWPEACRHGENGWAIGDGVTDEPDQDRRDVEALYAVLEKEVLPAYADRGRWTAMMRASIDTVRERFSSDRMVREYFEELYARDGAQPIGP